MYTDTTKGAYFASIDRNVKGSYSLAHNEYIKFIEKNLIAIFDTREIFYGCGGLICYNNNKLLLTADHVISCVLKSNSDSKIKIPINYITNLQSEKQDSFVNTISENTYYSNKELDFGVAIGFDDLETDGYKFFDFDDANIEIPQMKRKVLLIGIPDKRIVKAIHKTKSTFDKNVLVNGFQLPTVIKKITANYFDIKYPATFYVSDENFDTTHEARSPDPSGMSGSLVWTYNETECILKLLGIVIEGTSEGIKCTRADIILNKLKEFRHSTSR